MTKSAYLEKLRQQAMKEIRLSPEQISVEIEGLSKEELKSIIVERTTYQIELELQNKELTETQHRLIDSLHKQKALRAEFQRLYDNAPVAYVLLNSNGLIEGANNTFYTMTNLQQKLIVGRPFNRFIAPMEQSQFLVRFAAFFKNPQGKSFMLHLQTQHKEIPVSISAQRVDEDTSAHQLLRLAIMDVSANQTLQNELRLASRILEVTHNGIMVTDSNNKIIMINPAFTQITGYTLDDVLGKTPDMLSSGRHDDDFYQALWTSLKTKKYWAGDIQNRKKNGEIFHERLVINILTNEANEVTHYIGTFSDITNEKLASIKIEHLAQYDQLTELPNRHLLIDRLNHALKLAQRHNQKVAVLFMDLDHFKSLNDTLGHLAGDNLLRQIAFRLKATLRETDTIARFGGDEFVVIINEFDREQDVKALVDTICQKLLAELNRPFEIGDKIYQTTFSIGISLYPDDGEEHSELIKHADLAMYNAKNSGRNRASFFNKSLMTLANKASIIEQNLRIAIKNQQFKMYYQPQIDLHTGELVGIEALIRWLHPDNGMIAPDDFLPSAEKISLMADIDHFVIDAVFKQIAQWLSQGLQVPPISINASHNQFKAQSQLVENIKKTINHYNVSPEYIQIEVTESVIISDLHSAVMILDELKALGIKVALDDFGTGYSSLTYLRKLPIDFLKIDKSFVQGMLNNNDDNIIVESIIAMTQGMNITIVAEGIETQAQQTAIKDAGGHIGQGYLYSRPINANDFAKQFLKTSAVK